MDYEKTYFRTNKIALLFALNSLILGIVFNDFSLAIWIPLLILFTPTVVFGLFIVAVLIWSFYLTKESKVE